MPYHSYETLKADLQALGEQYPNITHLSEKGVTEDGRLIYDLQIGKSESNPNIFVIGCHHGNEKITVEMAFLWAKHLLENYGTDPMATKIVDNAWTHVIPMFNPDGHVANQRKNANGIDLNRNYPLHWCEAGSSTEPSSPIYKGTAPLSEVATNSMSALLNYYKPKFVITYHSGTEVLAYPWGYTKDFPPDREYYEALGQKINDHIKARGYDPYLFGQCSWNPRPPLKHPSTGEYVIYEASGACEDFAYTKGAKSLVLEVSYGYAPPESQIAPYFQRQFSLPLIVSMEVIGEVPERRGAASESLPVSATINPPSEKEPTTLTMSFDKTAYISGETMTITGKLNFTSDGVPLANRTVSIEQNGIPIAAATTQTDGTYQCTHTAPEVTQPTEFTYTAKFVGDI